MKCHCLLTTTQSKKHEKAKYTPRMPRGAIFQGRTIFQEIK